MTATVASIAVFLTQGSKLIGLIQTWSFRSHTFDLEELNRTNTFSLFSYEHGPSSVRIAFDYVFYFWRVITINSDLTFMLSKRILIT
jgi:hypothetical protein